MAHRAGLLYCVGLKEVPGTVRHLICEKNAADTNPNQSRRKGFTTHSKILAGYLRLLSLQCRRRGALGVVMGVEPTDGEEARPSPDATTVWTISPSLHSLGKVPRA